MKRKYHLAYPPDWGIQTKGLLGEFFEYSQFHLESYCADSWQSTQHMADADVILFTLHGPEAGPHFQLIRKSPLFIKYQKKIVVYCANDLQLPVIKGLYAAAIKNYSINQWSEPFHYFSPHVRTLSIRPSEIGVKPKICLFMGSCNTHPIRKQIRAINSPIIECKDVSTNEQPYWWQSAQADSYRGSYRCNMLMSKFVLCPRGVSPNSIRIYEAMECGSVPVIISDDLVLPDGPAWDSFSIRIPESRISTLPDVIEKMIPQQESMGRLARIAWENHFSPQVTYRILLERAYTLSISGISKPLLLVLKEYSTASSLIQKLRYAHLKYNETRT